MKTNKRHGISLIVLVITIIVMIILAAAIILSLNSAGIIGKANQAKNDTNDKQLLEAASLHLAEYELAEKTGDTSIAGKDEQTYIREKLVADGFTQEEADRVTVVDGEIVLADADSGNTDDGMPKIPEGFVASIYEGETDPATGLVIYQTTSLDGVDHETAMTTYNQYVWIPDEYVGEGDFGTNSDDTYIEEWGEYNPNSTEEKAEYDTLRQSIEDNGGFYIAKYDAGLPSGVTVDTANYGQNEGDLTIPVSIKDATPWTNIPWDSTVTADEDTGVTSSAGSWDNPGCAKVARATLNTSEIKSHLIYAFEIDSVNKFENEINKEVIYNTSYENEVSGGSTIENWNMMWYSISSDGVMDYNRDMFWNCIRANEVDPGFGFRVALYLQ